MKISFRSKRSTNITKKKFGGNKKITRKNNGLKFTTKKIGKLNVTKISSFKLKNINNKMMLNNKFNMKKFSSENRDLDAQLDQEAKIAEMQQDGQGVDMYDEEEGYDFDENSLPTESYDDQEDLGMDMEQLRRLYGGEDGQGMEGMGGLGERGRNDDEPQPLQVGLPAPYWESHGVVNKEFTTITLDDFTGKWLYMFFYPLSFTFVCPTEINAFSDRISEFKQRDCDVVAISCDSEYTQLAWINTPRDKGGIGDINIPLIADMNKRVSVDYGVLKPQEGYPLRGGFLISPEGTLRHHQVNDDPVGRDVDETLRVLDALQYTDEHPDEVCPIGWKLGDKTIDTKNSGEYFSQAEKPEKKTAKKTAKKSTKSAKSAKKDSAEKI